MRRTPDGGRDERVSEEPLARHAVILPEAGVALRVQRVEQRAHHERVRPDCAHRASAPRTPASANDTAHTHSSTRARPAAGGARAAEVSHGDQKTDAPRPSGRKPYQPAREPADGEADELHVNTDPGEHAARVPTARQRPRRTCVDMTSIHWSAGHLSAARRGTHRRTPRSHAKLKFWLYHTRCTAMISVCGGEARYCQARQLRKSDGGRTAYAAWAPTPAMIVMSTCKSRCTGRTSRTVIMNGYVRAP